jgi:hypothetical protein
MPEDLRMILVFLDTKKSPDRVQTNRKIERTMSGRACQASGSLSVEENAVPRASKSKTQNRMNSSAVHFDERLSKPAFSQA